MGIAKGAVSLLFELKKSENLKGVVCQLGRQTTYVTPAQLELIGKSFGVDTANYKYNCPQNALNPGMVSDADLFACLGFEIVESIDYHDYETPTHVLDLNIPVPEEYYNKYDLIYDGGTLEHVFNFPQCLKNIHHMLKPGGMIIHASPSHNHVDHGFYMFSPTLYYDYYYANKYKIVRSYIFEYEAQHATKSWIVYDYKPGTLDSWSHGGWGKKLLGIWFVSQKTKESTCDVIPQQNFYLRRWSDAENGLNELTRYNNESSFVHQLKKIVKKNPYISKPIVFLYGKLLPKKKRPPVLTRY